MKKILFSLIALITFTTISAQDKKKVADLSNRSGDHLMIQFTSDQWTGKPDSIDSHMKGLSRGANVAVMMDKPFKNNPKLSVAFGLGMGTSNIFFKNMAVDIKSKNNKLPFLRQDSLDHFKKYKVATAFLEIPLELRFSSKPTEPSKSVKGAIGIKVGTLLNAHTKGKTLLSKTGTTLNSYTAKETNKNYFNSTRITGTARLGYGNFSLVANYQFNNVFKDGVAADMKLFQIGLCISGL